VTTLILYSFYKNIALYLMELWFAFENGFSGQILFEKWTIAIYNIGFTLLPPIAIGIFDQHLSAATLMNVPHLYKSGQRRKHFNTKVFWSWTLNAIYHSLLLFWLPLQGRIRVLSRLLGLTGFL
jgi:phospholipid-transporting ATPase